MKLTDDEIAQAAHAFQQDQIEELGGIDDTWFEAMIQAGMRKILALDVQNRDDPPNRVGQWFKGASDGEIYGPIVASRNGKHLLQQHVDEGCGFCFDEEEVAAGRVLRIPPKLDGMTADECWEPVKGEKWYNFAGKLSGPMTDESDVSTDNVMGRRRWIYTPAKTWPAGPFATDDFGDLGVDVRQCDGAKRVARARDRETAEAIALALDWTRRASALMRTACPIQNKQAYPKAYALLAELDGWEFPK